MPILGRAGDYGDFGEGDLRFWEGWKTTAIFERVLDYGDFGEGGGLRRFWEGWGTTPILERVKGLRRFRVVGDYTGFGAGG